MCIRDSCKLFARDAAQRCHHVQHLDQIGGFIALAAMCCAGLIGGVGFQQQLFQRHVGHQFAQAVGAFKCHRPADAQ